MSKQSEKIAKHFRRLAREAGEAVSYRRGGVELKALTLVPGNSTRAAAQEQGASIVQDFTEWLCLPSDIAPDFAPAVNDEIRIGPKIWRVSKNGDSVYRPCDALGVMIRIFTKVQKPAVNP